ncbi:MAG: molybdopterin-binding protein, partial [Rickettsiales bacterium]|nr:molybdopterin-binding protein [Rickettsiales bacterium]
MNPIDSILQNMSQFVKQQPKEVLGLTDAFGRILAEPLVSPHAFPITDEAAKTGFAVRLSDITQLPISLNLVGTSNHSIPYTDPINPGETVLLYKHSPLPPNTDAVVPMEYTDITSYLDNRSYKPKLGDDIIIDRDVTLGANISMQGIDFDDDEIVVDVGCPVSSRVVSLAATMHIPWLTVRRKPRVGVLAVGSELKMLGDPGSRASVVSSSSYSLKCAIKACGAIPVNMGIVKDDPDAIDDVITATPGLDFLITTGGTSLSANNLLLNALAKNEDSMIYKEQVVIDEGEVVIYGNYGNMPFISL